MRDIVSLRDDFINLRILPTNWLGDSPSRFDEYAKYSSMVNSVVEFGVDDPADAGAAKVGKFSRIEGVTYQELQFQTYPEKKDIQFDNFTTVKIDVYFPSTNDYTGDLSQFIEIGFGDVSETQTGWWTDIVDQQTAADIALDQWVTYTFNLTNALTRTDLDMMYLNMGGAGHNAGGTFYVRNLIFE